MRKLFGLILIALSALVWAHQRAQFGNYTLIVGFVKEPPYTEERTGLDLLVQDGTGAGVEGLERALEVTLVAPNGAQRPCPLRAVHGAKGRYTCDFVLTRPGVYRILIRGYIGSTPVEAALESHEVKPLEELRFP